MAIYDYYRYLHLTHKNLLMIHLIAIHQVEIDHRNEFVKLTFQGFSSVGLRFYEKLTLLPTFINSKAEIQIAMTQTQEVIVLETNTVTYFLMVI